MKDNWKPRSSTMVCGTCLFYVPKRNKKNNSIVGRCRRSAPTLKGYPVVYYDDWCGEHKLDENCVVEEQDD